MIHLAQLHFNIDCLQIREESTSIKSSECYFTTPMKKEHPHPSVRIYDPLFASDMTQQGILLKKEYHTIPETNIDRCTPLHMCTFLKQTMDDYTRNLQIEVMNGAHIYILSNPSVKLESTIDNTIQSKLWNRILLSYKGRLVLQDYDHELNNSLVAHDTISVKNEVKQEFHHQLLSTPSLTQTAKSKEFIDKLVRPNTYQDVEDFMKQTDTTNNQTSLTANYNTRLFGPSHTQTKFSKCTVAMERQTKFLTCLRDGQAYSSLDFDFQHLDLFRAPTAPAFGILPQGLISGMFEELEEALVSDNHTKDVPSMKNLIDMMVMELFNAKRNKPSQRLFPKKAGQEQIKLLATKSLVSLFLLGKRFNNDSPKHYEICQRILNDITVQNERDLKPTLDEANEAVNSNNKRQIGIDAAWDQAKRYKTMTHREREDVVMHDTPPPPPPTPMQQKQGSINPLFRGRRHAPDIGSSPARTYPDPSIAIPYLHIPAPEKVLDDVNPGPPNSLLAQFWSAHQQRMKTIKDFDGRKIRYQTGE
ncbi:hypothetical protein BCR42DRAFT_123026 [Absidia repens]|uniref:Uncharacterized protein n=1 Tax=Absidia repens TaxID=90262 RepID=A0A1X2I4M0_9FUNG|nr:hypothetical protein BCR42DRAFT_123026 [Absidia repens]